MTKSDKYGGMSRLLAVFRVRAATFLEIANMDHGVPSAEWRRRQVLLGATPFCQRDTIIVTLEKPAHHSRLRRNILCNIRHVVNYVTQSGGINN